MRWSWRIGEVAGIAVYAHFTFLLLLVLVLGLHVVSGSKLAVMFEGLAFILVVFGCVLLHELGHALAARRYGILTADITLLPIGGLARLERMPRDPGQELWIALAGPAVNVAISAALFMMLELIEWAGLTDGNALRSWLTRLLWANLLLVGFNLIPAFPMDGGRVMRALLASRMDYVRATRIAAGAGQLIAVALAMLGLFFNWFLFLTALFVYVGAGQEARMVELQADQERVGASASGPACVIMSQPQRVQLPVRSTALWSIVHETDTLKETFDKMRVRQPYSVPIIRDGRVIGVVTIERVS